MNETSDLFSQATSEAMPNATSSRGSGAGAMPSDSRGGQMINPSGQPLVHASRIPARGAVLASMTAAISGRNVSRLLRECRPARLFGEQVSSPDGVAWLDFVSSDLEREDYAVAALVTAAAGVGAPHARHRLYFAADTDCERRKGLEPSQNPGESGPWGRFGEMDLRSILRSPRESGDSWPQPIICKMDDGISRRMERLRAYGNAIVPQVAAAFIGAYMETV